ncbi:hypothetical protein AHMF7605_28735 [Adhaeribacter arboris]|uniref:Uncharacterized protein n=2 Tax=Adhaeribacter arboris TaxID=2072846 RepID=A0A2T2Y8Q2_9BACT|nr:hypothetical protein AHMF7605_28735 [Adhaeribacter arboris]
MKKYDKPIALLFGFLTILFLVLLLTNTVFLNWVFARHQNQMSWFIRPLFIVPFCYFAYRQSWTGISIIIFAIFASMFWFNQPAIITDDVKAFLQFEIHWLSDTWKLKKVLFALVPLISFMTLGFSCWQRSIWMGLAVIAFMALGKMAWGIAQAGEPGKSMKIPATIGLLFCLSCIYFGFKQLEKRKPTNK